MRIVPSVKWRGDGRKVSILNVMAIFGSFVGRRPRCRIMPRDDVRAAAVRVTDTSPSPFSVPVIWLPAEAVEIEPEFEGHVSNGAETPVSQSDLDEYASAHGSAEEWEADYEDPDSSAFHLSIGAIPKSDRMQIHHETDAATHEQLVSAHARSAGTGTGTYTSTFTSTDIYTSTTALINECYREVQSRALEKSRDSCSAGCAKCLCKYANSQPILLRGVAEEQDENGERNFLSVPDVRFTAFPAGRSASPRPCTL